MAKDTAKIKFTADTSEFTQSIKNAERDMYSLRNEMKFAEAQFQNTGDKSEYLKTKQENLNSQLQTSRDKVEALTASLMWPEVYMERIPRKFKTGEQSLQKQKQNRKILKQHLNNVIMKLGRTQNRKIELKLQQKILRNQYKSRKRSLMI